MSRAIEQALAGLIPSYNGSLPEELLHLTTSLIAQSRASAGSLKPEEEVARPYACANIACERLKKTLGLPKIEPRPPCPPRVYKKLYAYLDKTLKAPSRNQRTPSKVVQTNQNDSSLPVSRAKTPARNPASLPTPLSSETSSQPAINNEESLPKWVMPTIRHVCTTFHQPQLAPHVFAGLGSVLKLQADTTSGDVPATASSRARGRRRKESHTTHREAELIEEDQLPALIIVLFLYVFTRASGKPHSPTDYAAQKQKAVGSLNTLAVGKLRPAGELNADIEHFMREAQNGWLDMEWFSNIQVAEPALDAGATSAIAEGEFKSDRSRNSGPSDNVLGNPQTGLGTMMQDRIDWLSEERRIDYKQWKKDIMTRIKKMESQDAMDVSVL